MEVVVVADPGEGVALVAGAIAALVARRPAAVLGLATGGSPEPLYDELARRSAAGEVDLRRVEAFLLDEYVGLPPSHPASYRAVIRRQVVEPLGLDPTRVHGPDGRAGDLAAECRRYDASIAAAGGVDLQLLGIGVDGHIGFNEPGSSLGSRTRLKTLTEQTVADNRRFFTGGGTGGGTGGDEASPAADATDATHATGAPRDTDRAGACEGEVPRHVLTQGIGTILEARHLVLMAWGAAKAPAVARTVEGPLTAMVPASALQLHPHATVVVDEAAAAGLELLDYYRWVYTRKPAWQGL